jgi:Na+/melibiose symporter-like transporter
MAAIVLGLGFWTRRAATRDKGTIFVEGLLWYVGLHTLVWVLATAGIWPALESPAYVPLYLVGTGLLPPFAVASVLAVGQSMMADCTDEDDLATGRRREGVFFGASSFAQKLTYGGGALIAGVIVDLVGLTGVKHVADVTAGMRLHLGLAMTLSVLVLIGLSWFAFRNYDLTRERVAEIHARLAARASA